MKELCNKDLKEYEAITVSSIEPITPFSNQSERQHADCFLTSTIVFELKCISDQRIRPFHLWNRLHLEPFVQVAAEHLVGNVCQSGDEDAHSKYRHCVTPKENCHLSGVSAVCLSVLLKHQGQAVHCICLSSEVYVVFVVIYRTLNIV